MRLYADAAAGFDVQQAASVLDGSLSDGLNACIECCDRHDGVALRYLAQDGRQETLDFAALRDRSARFAGVLRARGIAAGDVVAGLLPRIPDLLVTILGTWRAGAVYQPLFTAFGPKSIEQRLAGSGAKLVITNAAQRPKLDDVPAAPPVLTAGPELDAAMAQQPANFEPVLRHGDDPFMMLFTSGTTGAPKGVEVPLRALPAFAAYMRDAIGLRPEDRFWNVADPGWAYGLYYAVAGPLLLGGATTFYDGPFTAESTYRVIQAFGIDNLAGSPTAFRLLMAAGSESAAPLRGQLRVVSSAGEPLNPEVIRWFRDVLDAPIHDHYGQTELGMVVCNHHALSHPVRPGTAGLATPGYRMVVLDDTGQELPPSQPGILAVDLARSPLNWFRGYAGRAPDHAAYYRTGDTVEQAEDGTIAFVGRSDDIITSSGYRIGPFDVESALVEHPAVIEAAVVGKPDPARTEIVRAFVVLQQGYTPSDALAEELAQHVRRRLSAHAYPREVVFRDTLPKTPSGKLQRFLLRQEA